MGKKTEKSAYANSGVNIGKAEEAINLIRQHVHSTYNQYVLSKIGAFAGLLDASMIKSQNNPVLVFTTDGAGTKTMISKMMNKWSIGRDIVNHCVDDVLVSGAKPLAFLNYIAAANLEPGIIEKIVKNMAIACKKVGTPIIGGETAEMPDVYQEGEIDIVGFLVGSVEKTKVIECKALPKAGLFKLKFKILLLK